MTSKLRSTFSLGQSRQSSQNGVMTLPAKASSAANQPPAATSTTTTAAVLSINVNQFSHQCMIKQELQQQ